MYATQRKHCWAWKGRLGAAAVEFAVVAPVMVLFVFGILECGRAFMVLDLLANGARTGARAGAIPGNSNDNITTAVNGALASSGLNGAHTTILVNGTSVDASTAVSGDSISVNVSLPYGNVSWLPFNWFLSASTLLQETVVMRRE